MIEIPENIKKEAKGNEYTITVKEYNFLKKKVRELVEKFGIKLEARKEGKWLNFNLVINEDFVALIPTYLASEDNGRFTPRLTSEFRDLKREVQKIVNVLNETYSERDIMTDYHGHYRYNASVGFEIENENKIAEVIELCIEAHHAQGHRGFVYNGILKEYCSEYGIRFNNKDVY